MFQRDSYVKITDTSGNYHYGYISGSKERGFIIEIALYEEGLSKINWDNEYAHNTGVEILVKDFSKLLTDTEKKIIPLLAERRPTAEIARSLNIAPVTVRAHIRDLKLKFQLDTREQLFAYCHGIIKKLT